MGRINTVPGGFQSLLGSTNFGDNPSNMAEVVAPTLDMFAFLAQHKVYFGRTSNSTAAPAVVTTLTVPDNEIWGVIQAHASCNTNGVGDDVQFDIRLRYAPNIPVVDPNFQVAESDFVTSTIVSQPIRLIWKPNQIFWVQPGTSIAISANTYNAAGAASFPLKVMYYKLNV